jgi:hypothetical protein
MLAVAANQQTLSAREAVGPCLYEGVRGDARTPRSREQGYLGLVEQRPAAEAPSTDRRETERSFGNNGFPETTDLQ